MKPSGFEYHAPATLDEAIDLLATLDDAKILAGGQSLTPLLNLRLTRFAHLVDLRWIDELRGIERRNGSMWIGAATTQSTVERSADVTESVPLLARALPLIGHFQIRNRGTIGGSLAHADPSAEIPAVAVALDATIDAASAAGRRDIAADEFFVGFWSTALADAEVLTGVSFPVWSGRCGFAIEEVARRHGDFAVAGACVAVELADDTTVRRVAIGLLGLAPTPVRATGAELSITGAAAGSVAGGDVGEAAVADLDSIPSDLNGSEAYRRRVGATVVARAWARASEEALRG